ncbi:phosphate uptake regulator PhoU, partial [Candidatus Parcubacteria bacterium]|nr:phosphate uptake regulator PhoU [Candidatus Parcubacteria bacterium]
MEIRKLQLTGGSSLAITLPKKWVDHFGLKSKDTVVIYSQKSGSLIIQPAYYKEQLRKTVLKIDGLTKDMFTRELIAHYISGSDEITISGQRITHDQRNKIREVSHSLIGYEIIDESSEEIFIKNIFDATKFPIIQNVEKMFVVAKSMFNDAIKTMAQNNKPLARDVIDRDFEIDKLHLAIMRQFHALIQSRVFDEEIGLSQVDLNYYENVATQLERIADHAVKIAKTVVTADKKLENLVSSHIKNIAKKVLPLLEYSEEMVKKLDKILAHKILNKNPEIESILSVDKAVKSFEEIIVVDSLDRLRGYVMNMAEITINQAIAKKGGNRITLESNPTRHP